MNPNQTARLAERERAWNMARVRTQFTNAELAADCNRSVAWATAAIKDWIAGGYAREKGTRRNGRKVYVVTAKAGVPPVTDASGDPIAFDPLAPLTNETQDAALADRKAAWDIAKTREQFTVNELARDTKANVAWIRESIADWVRFGFARATGRTRMRSRVYEVTDKPGTPPVTDREGKKIVRQDPVKAMWTAMRRVPVFNHRDLSMQCTGPAVIVTAPAAQVYCETLAAAGYLHIESKGDPKADRPTLYRLIRNTGAKPPEIVKVQAVRDPNLGDRVTYVEGVPL